MVLLRGVELVLLHVAALMPDEGLSYAFAARPAVDAFDAPLSVELVEVPAHRHLRDAKLAGQVAHRDGPPLFAQGDE